jgi:hypothetical protein
MVATDLDVNGYGRPHTASSKAKISAANKGKVPWNAGRKHSEETKLRIAAKTREAIIRKKTEEAKNLGLSLTEYEESKEKKKLEKKKEKLKGGLTLEGRQRISASLKARWNDPEYRKLYTVNARGNRNHSESTRAKISEAIKAKWQDEKYRSKICISPSAEVRARISATLKAKWELPEFREKMMSSLSSRSDEWKLMISEKIREKWNDPVYRQAVEEGIRNSNRTYTFHSTSIRAPRRPKTQLYSQEEALERRMKAKEAKKVKEKQRRDVIKAAKLASSNVGVKNRLKTEGKSIKELLGGEIWFEEKVKRTKKGDPYIDDDSLEAQLNAEWQKDRNIFVDTDNEDDDSSLDDDTDADDEDWDLYDDNVTADVIEVYDEEGELVGTYTEAEFERLQKKK